MLDLVTRGEKTLIERQRWAEGFQQERILPSYDGLGLVNVPSFILQLLTPHGDELPKAIAPPLQPQILEDELITEKWNKWLNFGEINHVIFLILDGLGYDQLKTLIKDEDTPNLAQACCHERAFFMPITSVFPSTTTVALTSAATACSPSQHGVVGTTMYLREIGSIAHFIHWRPALAPTNAVYLDSQLNPDTIIPVPNIYSLLEKAGINVEIVNHHYFKQSSISRYTSTGSQAGLDGYHGYLTPQQGFAQLRDRLIGKTSAKSLTYMYVPNIDASAHRYAPLSDYYRAEVSSLDYSLHRELIQPLAGRNDTVLIAIADHGQRITNQEQVLRLNDHPGLTDNLFVPPTGSSQGRYLHVKHNREAQVIDYIQDKFNDDFLVISQDQAVELGLFGQPNYPLGKESCDRIGDLILLPRNQWSCFHFLGTTSEPPKKVNAGLHGGLSRAEMLIPFLAYRF